MTFQNFKKWMDKKHGSKIENSEIIVEEKALELEQDLVDLLIDYGYIAEEKRSMVKHVGIDTHPESPIRIEVIEEEVRE